MAFTPIQNIKNEMIQFLRNQDIISISDRGVTTSQDTGTFAADSSHTLGTNPTLVKNVRSIVVASVTLTYGTDYTVNFDTGVLSFTSPQTGAYVIDYDQGAGDKIYPDFPQPHLKNASFPRIAAEIISGETAEAALGGGSNWTEYLMTIVAYDKNQEDVETMIAAIREDIMSNKKTFFYFPFITPSAMGPILPEPFGDNKIMRRNQDFRIRFIHEQ